MSQRDRDGGDSEYGGNGGNDGVHGHDELGARRRASWGRRDDERAEERGRDEHAGGRGLDEHEETQSHAGNGTVNHGPEEQGPNPKGQGLEGRGPDDLGPDDLGPDGSGLGKAGSGNAGSGGLGPDGFDSDELVLRNLLHHAVSEIEPSEGTLEHLRRAVPARRARKRQAVVGMAAAALFIGTAIPALVHVSNATGSDVNPSVVGNGSHTQGNAGQSKGQTGGGSSSGGSSSGSTDSGKSSDKDQDDKGKGDSAGTTGGPAVTATAVGAPTCTAAQLGGTASAGSPDSSGAVYGTFHVANNSGDSCTVAGAGGVNTTPQGAADASRISVANHVAGDAATGLPDPSLSPTQLVLAPGEAYEVQFAWVPLETCPTTGGTTDGGTGGTDPSTDPTPTETPGTTTDGNSSMTTQLVLEDGGVEDGSVLVSYTAEGGVATFTTGVSNACAGVVYRTGLLAAT